MYIFVLSCSRVDVFSHKKEGKKKNKNITFRVMVVKTIIRFFYNIKRIQNDLREL